jgi:hypothetical protein
VARTPNRFFDPSDSTEYLWPINHLEEDDIGITTGISTSAPTSGIGLVRQQGEDSAMSIIVRGTILTLAQHQTFIAWKARSRNHTIYFTDFAGEQYEVLIKSYLPRRERVQKNPRDPLMPNYVIRYTMEMDVIQALSGSWA